MIHLHHADANQYLASLPDAAVQAVVTDPPYGTGGWVNVGTRKVKRVKHAWDTWTTDWLDQAWRVSGGHVGVFCPMANLPSMFAWIGDKPFRVCSWCKTNPRPQFNKRPAYGMEMFVVVGDVQPCAQKGKLFTDYILTPIETRNKHHPYQKPTKVMEWAVNMVCPPNGTVLDPFMGGGSTGVACINTSRAFVGVERDDAHFEAAKKRLEATEPSQSLWTPSVPQRASSSSTSL